MALNLAERALERRAWQRVARSIPARHASHNAHGDEHRELYRFIDHLRIFLGMSPLDGTRTGKMSRALPGERLIAEAEVRGGELVDVLRRVCKHG